MTGQQNRFEFRVPPRARRTDPETSRRAWIDNLPRAGTQRRRVWDALEARGPSICSDLCEATGIRWNSASSRISELIRAGLARDTGDRRMGPDGSYQRVIAAVTR